MRLPPVKIAVLDLYNNEPNQGMRCIKEIVGNASGSVANHAKHYRDEVIPAMGEVRSVADALEMIVSDDLWPLPTYQEMLFIK